MGYAWQSTVIGKLNAILKNQEKQMAAIDDVNTAISGLSTEITTFLADVAAQISGGLTANEAEAVVTQIQGFTTQLQAADPANPTPPVATPPASSPNVSGNPL
jgi:hypothetical protein